MDAEANLRDLTDDQWLDGHASLVESGQVDTFPPHELTFVWDPQLDPATLIDPAEHDEARTDG